LAAFQKYFSCRQTRPETHKALTAKGNPISGISASNPDIKQRNEPWSILILTSGMVATPFILNRD
jgi:hypothetical protein